jgi:hypothetical protein
MSLPNFIELKRDGDGDNESETLIAINYIKSINRNYIRIANTETGIRTNTLRGIGGDQMITFEDIKIPITESEFENIKKQLSIIDKYDTVVQENQALKLHISLMPGGAEYFQAQSNFSKNK